MAAPKAQQGEGVSDAAPIPFREIWCCDSEFRADAGERPWPVCMVACELGTGRDLRL